MQPFGCDQIAGTDYMKLGGPKAEAVGQSSSDGVFAVLHTGRDFGKEDVVLLEVGVALGDLGEVLGFGPSDGTGHLVNGLTGDSGCWLRVLGLGGLTDATLERGIQVQSAGTWENGSIDGALFMVF